MVRTIVLVLLATLPWTGAVVALGVPSPVRAVSILSLVVLLPVILKKGATRPSPVTWLFLLYFAIFFLSYFWGASDRDWLGQIGSFASIFIVLAVLDQTCPDIVGKGSAMRALAIGAAVLAFIVLVNVALGHNYELDRASAGDVDPNEVAVFMAIGVASSFGTEARTSSMWRWLLVAIVGLAILRTGSRTGMLCLVLVVAAQVWFGMKGLRGKVIALAILTIIASAGQIAWNNLPSSIANRVTDTSLVVEGRKSEDRFGIWSDGMSIAYESLPLGVGGAGFAAAMQHEKGRYVVAHNVWLELFAEFGFLSILLIGVTSIVFFRSKFWRERDPGRLALACVLITSSMTLSIQIRPMFWVAIWMVVVQEKRRLECA